MKKFVMLVSVLLVFSVICGAAFARDGEDRRKGKQGGRGQGRPGIARLIESFNLNEDQLARVKQIFETGRQADINWKKEHAEDLKGIQQAMVKARKDRDHDAVKAALDRMKKLLASRKEASGNLFVQLSEVLSKEQLAKVKSVMNPQRSAAGANLLRSRAFGAALEKLDLTDAEKS